MRYPFYRQTLFSTQAIIICAVGALIGVLSVWLPSFFLFAGLGIIYILVAWYWPEFALLSILLLLATVFDENALPSLSIGVGHLIVSDLLLFIPIAFLLLRNWINPGVSFVHTPLDFPLLAFYSVALFSTISAIVHGTVTFNQSLGELRVVNLYLAFFIVTNLIRDEKHLHRLLNGIFVLSVLVALMMIVQYFLGDITQILPGRVETLFTAGASDPQVTRVLPPGQSLVLISSIVFPILLIVDRSSPKVLLRLCLMFIVGFATIITFNRNFWVAFAIALLLAILLSSIPEKIRFVNISIWSLVIVIMIFILVISFSGNQAQALINGVVTRFNTLLNPQTLISESSIQWRVVESEYALPQIIAHPLIGLGLGADYRPWDSRVDFVLAPYDQFAYIHDGHLWMVLKTGLIGYLLFIWFLFLFLQRSLKFWRKISDPFHKAMVLSFALAMIGILPATLVNPIFFESYWTPLIGIMMGVNEVIFRLNQEANTNIVA